MISRDFSLLKFLVLLVAVIYSHGNENPYGHYHSHGHSNATNWYCPEGWVPYTDGTDNSCLYFSVEQVHNFQLHRACRESHRANPVMILTQHKSDFIIAQAAINEREYLLPLTKSSGYGDVFFWASTNLPAAQDYYQPPSLADATNDYERKCVYVSGLTQEWEVNECETELSYICEVAPDCVAGTFGKSCSQECHCVGEPCDADNRYPVCRWGCQRGWAGRSCSTVREHPDVKYFCINSPEEDIGTYVDVHIYTKGVNYRSINPTLANGSETGGWCGGTTISRRDQDHIDVAIHLNDSVREEIARGECAGQELENGNLQWTIAIQEYEGIVLDTDLQVTISCDFNNSETMQRTAQIELEGKHSPAQKVDNSPESTDVTLLLVDPYSFEPIKEAHVGTPAKLQIKLGDADGSMVTGVSPHHCVATSPSGSVVKPLLDENGCSNSNSPVGEFDLDVDLNRSISTEWFPLFAVAGHENVEFKCSFDLCFKYTSHCEPKCRHDYNHHRYRRDMSSELDRHNMESNSAVVRILPGVKRLTSSDDWPSQQRPEVLNLKPEPESDTRPTTKASMSKVQTDLHSDLMTILNPVTFVVFLVLLVIFLAVFLTLHHALFKNITALRQDLVSSQQSRDELIHYKSSERLINEPKVAV